MEQPFSKEKLKDFYIEPLGAISSKKEPGKGIEEKEKFFQETKIKIQKVIEEGDGLLLESEEEINKLREEALKEILDSDLSQQEKEALIEWVETRIAAVQHELQTRVYEAVKSWWEYVHNSAQCFKCAYCILSSRRDLQENGGVSGIESFIDREIGDVPSNVSQVLEKIPVAINNYFGDPGMQWKDTIMRLETLEKAGHKGPVGIISKSYFSEERAERLAQSSCKVVVLQSISNLPKTIEPVSHRKRIESLKNLVQAEVPSIAYLRPLIPGYNTHKDILRATLDSIAQTGCRIVCYSGLRGTEDVLELLEKQTGRKIEPPKGYKEWQKDHKLVEGEVKEFIESYIKKLGLLVFRKTSCAVSYASGLESDYNCHWAQPEKYGCEECVMSEKCAKAAAGWSADSQQRVQDALKILGAKGEVVKEPRQGACQLKEVCHFPCSSCPVSGGLRLKLKGKWSLGELSVARWVAGIPVEAEEIIDTPRIFHLNLEPK